MSVIVFLLQVNKEDCLVYDPIFCDMEKEMIEEYNCSLITKNEVMLIYFMYFYSVKFEWNCNPPWLRLTHNTLIYLKDYKKFIHILNHILDLVWPK